MFFFNFRIFYALHSQQMFFRNAAYEAIVVAAICLLALADYALWARRTVREMCLFLGIRCFSLGNRVKTE